MADGEKLNWAFELFDRMSGPAKQMAEKLDGLEQRMARIEGRVDGFGKKAAGAGSDLLSMGAALGGWATALSKAGDIMSSIGNTVFGWGKQAINALAFRESTLASFEMMLGTKKAADELFADATSMARTTPFDTKDVVESYKTLLTAGFKKAEIPIVFQAVGDQAAAMGMKKEVIGQLANVFGQIKAQGRVLGNDLIQLSTAGISRKEFMTNLAKRMGISKEGARAALSSGAADADQAIVAILDTIAQKSGGGVIGGGMERQSQTITGLFSNLESVVDDFFFAFDKAEDLPGLVAFKGTLTNLISLFNLSGETGKRTLKMMEQMFNDTFGALFGGLNGPDGLKRMEKGFGTFLDVVKQGWEVIKGIGRGIEAFWKELEPTLDKFVPAGTDLTKLQTVGEKMGSAFEKAGGALGRMATSIINLMDAADRSGFFNMLNYLLGGTTNGNALAAVGARPAEVGEVGYDPANGAAGAVGLPPPAPNGAAAGRSTVQLYMPFAIYGNPKPEEVKKAAAEGGDSLVNALERLNQQRGGR